MPVVRPKGTGMCCVSSPDSGIFMSSTSMASKARAVIPGIPSAKMISSTVMAVFIEAYTREKQDATEAYKRAKQDAMMIMRTDGSRWNVLGLLVLGPKIGDEMGGGDKPQSQKMSNFTGKCCTEKCCTPCLPSPIFSSLICTSGMQRSVLPVKNASLALIRSSSVIGRCWMSLTTTSFGERTRSLNEVRKLNKVRKRRTQAHTMNIKRAQRIQTKTAVCI